MTYLKQMAAWAVVVIVLTGCTAGWRAFDDGQDLIRAGKIDEGLAALEQATRENPKNLEYKTYYLRQKEQYVSFLMSKADAAREAKRYGEAENGYRHVLKYDAHHPRATDALNGLRDDLRHDEMSANADKLIKAGKTDEAQSLLRTVLAEDPQHGGARRLMNELENQAAAQKSASNGLGAAFKKPITLEFRDASLKAIFEVIARATQINFIFDRDVRPDLKSTIFVKNTTIEEAINLLLVTNQLEKRVLNENTVLIYPNTPAKAKDYQEQVVRAFYLANADVKQTLNMIKTLVKTRDVFIDDKLNMLVMKDTPDAIRLAEKLIATQDRPEPEVMLEVEVLEVKRNRLLDLGIQYPNTFTALNIGQQQTSTQIGTAPVITTGIQTQNIVTVDTLRNLTGSNIAVSPNLGVNLKKEDGDAQILANPRIRVKNREKAKIHIGDKVPVITTTSTANVGVSESVNYLDVGLKLDVEPQVYLDQEVGIKVGLEVSNIVREVRSQTGTLTYQIGTRNAATVLRLKDGETQVLAGLISDEDRQSASKIPGLGDLPLVGRLFSTHRDEANKTEIVLLITPHIVRNITRLDVGMSQFPSGTESAIGAPPLTLSTSLAAAPALVLTGTNGAGARSRPVVPAVTPAASAAPATAAAASPLALSLSTVPGVGKDQEFDLVVQANASSEVKSLAFDLAYDPQQVEVVRATEAAFFKQGNAVTEFKSESDSGHLHVDIQRGEGGARGAGAVAVIVLRAVAATVDATQIKIENVQAANAEGAPLAGVTAAPTTVNITP